MIETVTVFYIGYLHWYDILGTNKRLLSSLTLQALHIPTYFTSRHGQACVTSANLGLDEKWSLLTVYC